MVAWERTQVATFTVLGTILLGSDPIKGPDPIKQTHRVNGLLHVAGLTHPTAKANWI